MQPDREKIFAHLNVAAERYFRAGTFLPVDVLFDYSDSESFGNEEEIDVESPFNFQLFLFWNIEKKFPKKMKKNVYHRSTWRLRNVLRAALRVSNLKPHCVSRMPLTHRNQTRKWKPYMRNVRSGERFFCCYVFYIF